MEFPLFTGRTYVSVMDLEFTVHQVRVKFEFSFVLILAFIALSEYSDAIWVLVFSSLHECGHLAALYAAGGRPEQLTLSFYGFGLRYNSCLTPAREAMVLLAGPAMNLFFWLLLQDTVNPVLFCLNCLPIYPLDGGRLLSLFVKPSVLRGISLFFLIAVLGLSVYLLLFYHSFSLLLIAVYLMISNKRYI